MIPKPLVVGIGSPHGDDQAGWILIDRLSKRGCDHMHLQIASVPHNLIDWCGDCDLLHIVDACDNAISVQRMDLSNAKAPPTTNRMTRCHSSHAFGIDEVLELGRTLDTLPSRIVVWAIPGRNFGPGHEISNLCRQGIESCAKRIQDELANI